MPGLSWIYTTNIIIVGGGTDEINRKRRVDFKRS